MRGSPAHHVVFILGLAGHDECSCFCAPGLEAEATVQRQRAHIAGVNTEMDLGHAKRLPDVGQGVLQQP